MSSVRDVSSLPLASSMIERLLQCGLRQASDVAVMSAVELADELRVTPSEALEVIAACNFDASPAVGSFGSQSMPQTAKDLLSSELAEKAVITFCKDLDTILGGGVARGQITEFCGVPGIGKTQLSMQLACNVQIPEIFNGAAGEAVYIDTEGSFIPERAADIANELAAHLKKLAKMSAARGRTPEVVAESNALADSLSGDSILEHIHYYRCHNQTELIAVVRILPGLLRTNKNIKLIVIDSIAFHFRADILDPSSRNRTLSTIASSLNGMAAEFKVAVVVTNHITTKIIRIADSNKARSIGVYQSHMQSRTVLSPALGEQWSHCISNRVMLEFDSQQGSSQRCATLIKSPSLPSRTVLYQVSFKGIRDVAGRKSSTDVQSGPQGQSSHEDTIVTTDENKRRRVL